MRKVGIAFSFRKGKNIIGKSWIQPKVCNTGIVCQYLGCGGSWEQASITAERCNLDCNSSLHGSPLFLSHHGQIPCKNITQLVIIREGARQAPITGQADNWEQLQLAIQAGSSLQLLGEMAALVFQSAALTNFSLLIQLSETAKT